MKRQIIEACDRDKACNWIPGADDVIISISDPGTIRDLRPGWNAILRVQFYDYPWPDWPEFERATLQTEDADRIAEFAIKHRAAKRLVVHCDAGISRSPAVAMAISVTLHRHWAFPRWYDAERRAERYLVNRPVFDRVTHALTRRLAGAPKDG